MSDSREFQAPNPWKRPGIIWCVLFVLIFSGPPKFRVREGGAGVTEGLDLALIIQIGVFIAVGFYLLLEGRKIQLDLPQKLAAVLLGTFFISAFHSEYPAYTIFRAFQAKILAKFIFAPAKLRAFVITEKGFFEGISMFRNRIKDFQKALAATEVQ